jgi:hypothetical protein
MPDPVPGDLRVTPVQCPWVRAVAILFLVASALLLTSGGCNVSSASETNVRGFKGGRISATVAGSRT